MQSALPVVPAPHPENQLVLYLRGPEALAAANPYWNQRGAVLFEDPDGWLVVLAPWVFGEPTETARMMWHCRCGSSSNTHGGRPR